MVLNWFAQRNQAFILFNNQVMALSSYILVGSICYCFCTYNTNKHVQIWIGRKKEIKIKEQKIKGVLVRSLCSVIFVCLQFVLK